MRIGEVMTRGLEIVSPDATIKEAATRMAKADVGAILVGNVDELQGISTDRDIIIRVVVEGRDPSAVDVSDVMSATLFACSEDDSLEFAVAEMKKRQVRRLPVLDVSGKPVGIVALSDLSRHLGLPDVEQLRRIVEPHRDVDSVRDQDKPSIRMTAQQSIAFAIIALTMAMFVWGRVRFDLVALLALLASVATGIVPPERAFRGFSD